MTSHQARPDPLAVSAQRSGRARQPNKTALAAGHPGESLGCLALSLLGPVAKDLLHCPVPGGSTVVVALAGGPGRRVDNEGCE